MNNTQRIERALRALLLPLLVLSVVSGTTLVSAQSSSSYVVDADGNRTSATNQIRLTGIGGFSIEPNRAIPGDRINIYGRNFDVTDPSQFAIDFNGEAGVVHSVSRRVITVEIPLTAVDGAIVLTLPGGTQVNVGSLVLEGVVVTPDVADLDYGTSQQFAAVVHGVPGGVVNWEVESLVAGADPGSVSATGLYTAPAAVNGAFPVLVKATSVDLGHTAYALVRGSCASTMIALDTFVAGSFVSGYERNCYEFDGTAGQIVSASYIGSPTARRFRILNEDGYPVVAATPGTSIATSVVVLPDTGVYRVEVESDSGESGAYQVYVATHEDLTPGVWIHPGDGLWSESSKWSGGVVPSASSDVIIPDYPGTLTVTVNSNVGTCASVVANEEIRFISSGRLNVLGTLTHNAGMRMQGGTLAGARLEQGGGPGVITTTSGGTFAGVTVASSLLIGPSHSLTATGGLTLDGGTITLGTATNGHSYLYFTGTQTLGGNGEIVMEDSPGGYTRYLYLLGGTTHLTIGSDITVRGAHGNLLSGSANQQFINLGTIRADVAGEPFAASRLANFGMLQATGGLLDVDHLTGALGQLDISASGSANLDGIYTVDQPVVVRDSSTLILDGTWVNASSITMTDSVVTLDGTFTPTALGSFSRTGGTVNLSGVCDLQSSTFTLDATTGDWRMVGGRFANGTLVTSPGGTVLPTTSGGTFDAMTIVGSGFTLPSGSIVTLVNGLTLDATIALGGPENGHTYLYVSGTQTIDGAGAIEFINSPGGYTRYLYTLAAGTIVTLGPNLTVHGRDGYMFTSAATQQFQNQGTIRADADTVTVNRISNSGSLEGVGGTLDVNNLNGNLGMVSVASSGTVDVDGTYTVDQPIVVRDSSALTLRGTWTNASSIAMTDSVINLGGDFTMTGLGSFSRSGGTVNLIGTCDLQASTLTLDGLTGDWRMLGGSLANGTLVTAGGTLIPTTSGGSLDAMVVGGSGFTLPSGTNMTLLNGLVLDATIALGTTVNGHTYLYVNGTQTISGSGAIEFVNSPTGYTRYLYVQGTSSVVTLGADMTVHGRDGILFTTSATQQFQNMGTIRADADTVTANRITNSGSFEGVGGTLDVNNLSGNLGMVSVAASGTVDVDGTYTVDQPIVVRDSSTLTLRGTWSSASSVAMTDSVVNLGGNFTITGLGSFSRSGGTVNLIGTCDLEGGTFTLDALTGDWRMVAGTMTNGTLATSPGGDLIATSSGGTFDDMTLSGAGFQIPSGASLTSTNGMTLDNGIITVGTTDNGHSYFYLNGTQTIGGTGEVVFANSPTGYTRFMNVLGTGAQVTFGAGVTIHGRDASMTASPGQQFINEGTIAADADEVTVTRITNLGEFAADGGLLDVNNLTGSLGLVTLSSSGSMEIEGTYTVDQPVTIRDTSTLTLDGTWSNASSISMTTSTVNLDGNFTVTGLGSFSRTGGTVNLAGICDLEGGSMAFDAITGSWQVTGGGFVNGTVSGTGGFGIRADNGGTLDAVTLQGDCLLVESGGWITLLNGLTLDGSTVTLGESTNGHSYIYCSGTQTIGGTGEIVAIDSPTGYTRFITPQAAGTVLTIGSNVTVRGAHLTFNTASNNSIVNDGAIQSDVNGETVYISRVTNNGSLDALNGGILTLDISWSNAGTISVVDSHLNLDGDFTLTDLGTITRSGGTIEIDDDLDLEGGTLAFDATTGSWDLRNGSVANGTIDGSDGEGLVATNGGTLNAVTLVGTGFRIPPSGSVTAVNGLTVDGTLTMGSAANGHSYLSLSGTQTIGGSGEIVMVDNPSGYVRYLRTIGTGTVGTIGPNLTVRGADGSLQASQVDQSWINNGTIRSEVSGQEITVQDLTNDGIIESVGEARFRSNGTFTNNSTVTLDAGSIWVSNDDWTQSTSGTLQIAVESLSLFGVINVSDAASFAGVLDVDFGFTPTIGDTFDLITYSSTSGSFSTVSATGLGGGQSVTATYGAAAATLEVQ